MSLDDRHDDDPGGEREAAVRAAETLLAGPTLTVRRTTWLAVIALMREAVRLLEQVLDEADEAADRGVNDN